MKKFLRIFIFFIIAISLFFVNEVYADIDYDSECSNAENDLDSQQPWFDTDWGQYRIIVQYGDSQLHKADYTAYWGSDQEQKDTRKQKIDLSDCVVSLNEKIEVFCYYERLGAKGPVDVILYDPGSISWSKDKAEVDYDGNNALVGLWHFTLKSTGETSMTFELDGDVEDITINLTFYIEPEPEPEPIKPVVPCLKYEDECANAEKKMNSDGVQVVISQGNYLNRNYAWADNDCNQTINLSTTSFALESDLVFFIYAEQAGVEAGVNTEFSYECNPEKGVSVIARRFEDNKTGNNSLQGMYRWKFNQAGIHTIKVTLTGKNVNTIITLILKVEKGISPPEGTFDSADIMGEMQDELKNGEFGIQVKQFADGTEIAKELGGEKFSNIKSYENNSVKYDTRGDFTIKRNTGFVVYFQLEKAWINECEVKGLEKYENSLIDCTLGLTQVDTIGTNSANGFIQFNIGSAGDHTIKFTLDTDECEVSVTLIITIDSNLLNIGADIDYEEECKEAEKKLDNQDLLIIVDSGGERISSIYRDVDKSQAIGIDASSKIKFNKKGACEILVYYEWEGLKEGSLVLINEQVPCPLSDIEGPSGEVDFNWRRAYSGEFGCRFNDYAGNVVQIPLVMKVKNGTNKSREFKITIRIEFEREPNKDFEDFIHNIENYKPNTSTGDTAGIKEIENKAGTVLSVITNVGVIATVIILMILGVKYMLGSVEERADYKKDLVPYMVGAVLLFGICIFIKILQSIGNTINNI